MEIKITDTFASDFKIVKDQGLKNKIKDIIDSVKSVDAVSELSILKTIQGNKNAYRISVGFYTLVLLKDDKNKMILMRLLHRDTIFKALMK